MNRRKIYIKKIVN